jgi:hypothetical protein
MTKRETIRQLTPDERARLDADAKTCAAEVVGTTTTTSGRLGRLRATVRRAGVAIVAAGNRILNRQNVDAALAGSKDFAKLVAKYGAEAAREAVLRHVRKGVEDKIGAAIGNGFGGAGGSGSVDGGHVKMR